MAQNFLDNTLYEMDNLIVLRGMNDEAETGFPVGRYVYEATVKTNSINISPLQG